VWEGKHLKYPTMVPLIKREMETNLNAVFDGDELWFLRNYSGSPAIFRSKNTDGEWQEAELILSQFAGEPSLDSEGNIYFVHHYFKDCKMLEADYYVAYMK